MSFIVAVTACPTGVAHTAMAAEALRKQAELLGHEIRVEMQGSVGATEQLDAADIARADAVILATDISIDESRFQGKPIYTTSTASAIRDPAGAIHAALRPLGGEVGAAPPQRPAQEPPAEAAPAATRPPREEVPVPAASAGRKLVAITACPTGIAHTFMAAEALRKQAEAMGHSIQIETQGSVGAKNKLDETAIAEADAVVIAADTAVDESRFAGKSIFRTDTGAALKQPASVIEQALSRASAPGAAGTTAETGAPPSYAEQVGQAKKQKSEQRAGPYKHLLTGVSYMLPVVVAGGLLIALSFVWGIDAFEEEGTLPAALMDIGGGAAFALMVPVLSGFIAYSIADRPGLAPGLVGGMLASQLGAGFLGGIVSGFIAGYVARAVRDYVPLPQNFEGLKPVLVIPLIATLVTGLLMVYVVGAPVRAIMDGLTAWLSGLTATNALLLGVILGGMMAFDMGGPVNKAAYTFSVGLLSAETYAPMAAVMAAGMVPPLSLALATVIARRKFNDDERQAGKAAFVLGICFITEGAIPFAAKDPLRVIPTLMVGAATTGALSMLFGCTLRAPHGGVFVLAIPNAVGNLALYVVSILVGTVIAAVLLSLVKPRVETAEVVGAVSKAG